VTLLSGGFKGSKREGWFGRVRTVRSSGPIALHLELPRLLRRCYPVDVIVEDLAHVVPFFAERFSAIPGVAYFRHLHRRTLRGQVGLVARTVLTATERSYPMIYRRWPLVAMSPSSAKDLVSLGFDPSRIRVIGLGVDVDTFKPGQLTKIPSLTYFAGLRRYKRPDHALFALKILLEQGVEARLSVVGRGPELPSLQRLSDRLGLSGHVSFTGWLTENELGALLGTTWVHVQCSVAEGWGLTSSEAAASGVPTVAYRVPGLVDSVVDGISGTLVRDGDIPALAAAIATIIRDRPEWSDRSRRTVLGHSWKDAANQWDILLTKVASGQ
jgi:glycosyltransferase involved in cell wall biosynthesis